MEPNLPVVARRFWNMVRIAFFMLRKGISKRKFMVDFNMMLKRGKIAGKAMTTLMFHLHHHNSSASNNRSHLSSTIPTPPTEYEFSCGNSPAFQKIHFPFHFSKRKNNQHSHFFSCVHAPPTNDDDDDMATVNVVKKVLEMLNASEMVAEAPAASPVLPGFGFGRSPFVRQLRITDSPYPLKDVEVDNQVDKAAEEFIEKFYNQLKKQNSME